MYCLKSSFLAFTVCASVASASLINFQSGVVTNALQSDGSTSLSSEPEGTFEFALGLFDETVLSGSKSTWESGFTNEMVDTNVWKTVGPPVLTDKFQGEVSMDDGSSTGQLAYILGFSTVGDDFIVFKNSSWIFPAFAAIDTNGADTFSLLDSGTEVLLDSGSFASYGGSFTMIAVPEPSAFGLIAGLLGLTWVGLRRRR